jgi:hypothetical protein
MWQRILLFLLLVISSSAGAPPTTKATERPIKILNESYVVGGVDA